MFEKYLEIVSEEPEKAIYREYEEAPLAENQIRVRVEYAAAKHGTEFTSFRGDSVHETHEYNDKKQLFVPRSGGKQRYGMRPGNMWVGRVTELGEAVSRFKVGDRVSSYGSFRMTQTRRADWVRPVPEDMDWRSVVCYDPLQFALGGVRDGNVRAGDNVVVFGLGAIGLLAAQLARLSGASKVIVCDPIAVRRQAALDNGADYVIDSVQEDAGYVVKELTDGRGADVCIETSGNYNALQAAIRGAAYNANIAVVGWYHECKGGLDLGWEAHFNQPNILLSRACSDPNRDYPRWDFNRICNTCWSMLEKSLLRCGNIIDPVVPFDQAAQTYMNIYRDPSSSIKIGVSFL
jgi:threonine dehydrogenase-like Zn-dependent dehydrogenase